MTGMHDNWYYGPPRGSDGRGRRSRTGPKLLAGLLGVAFAVGLAVVIGQRLSDQAVSVLAGAVCGVSASIPTSLLIVWATRRRREERAAQPAPGVYPPVVVVQSPPQTAGPASHQFGQLPPYVQNAPREFTVVGGQPEDAGITDYL